MANNEELILNVETNSPYVIGAVAKVEQLPNGALITITDKSGTTTATVLNGVDGTGIASATLNADYTLTLLFTDGTSMTTTSIRGATGESGVYCGADEPTNPDVNVWVDPTGDPYPMEDEIADAVDDWITAHPEYVTTVQDGAITVPKFAAGVVDTGLNKVGYPAESKATGDAIAADRTRLTAVEGEADALDARITSLATLTEGSTTGDAELIDARTVGSTTYASLHQAIDTEFTNVKSDYNVVDSYLDVETGVNRFDVNRITENYYLNNGVPAPLNDWNISNYIYVGDVKSVVCSGEYNGNRAGCTMYFLSTYDEMKNYKATKSNATTYTVESGIAYIRFCYHPSLWSNIMVEEGTIASAYTPYEVKGVTLKPSPYNEPIELEDFGEVLKTSFAPIWGERNISYPNTNKFVTYQGAVADYTNASYSSDILCDGFKVRQIKFNGSAWSGIPAIVFFNSSDAVVSTFPSEPPSSATLYADELITFPDSAEYFILNNLTNLGAFRPPLIKEVSKYNASNWQGIKWVVVGDSLTELNQRTTQHYFDYIVDKTDINVYNMGVSGTGYARGADTNNAFYQRISAVPIDADVITIFGSFNDLSAGLELGTVTDSGTTTLCGCINKTIDNLLAVLPLANFGIVTPCPWSWTNPASVDSAASQYCDAIIQICRNRGIPCLDLFHNSLLRPWESSFRELAYTRDEGNGVHPDENGHKLIAPRFKGFLDTLLI